MISIHAPREGSDRVVRLIQNYDSDISIHAPREGSDLRTQTVTPPAASKFLSTLPARGATGAGHPPQYRRADFYPRSPRGERLVFMFVLLSQILISIHAPREGSDRDVLVLNVKAQSISIHAPREGSDMSLCWTCPTTLIFLSTLPARGATGHGADLRRAAGHFYPRSPRGERPIPGSTGWTAAPDFYPRSPRGERRWTKASCPRPCPFLSTLPARGATWISVRSLKAWPFLSTLPARGATSSPPLPPSAW